jgi:ABC-type sugar transport system permease subunit
MSAGGPAGIISVGSPHFWSLAQRESQEVHIIMLRSISRRKRRELFWRYVFVMPQLVLYLGLTLVPFIVALPLLFTDRIDYSDVDVDYVGFANFTKVFTDFSVRQDYWPALGRNAVFFVLNYATVFVFGLSLALLMYEIGFRGGFFTVIYLPWMISGLAVGFIVVMLFAKSTGTLNLLLLELGWIKKPIDIKVPIGPIAVLPIFVGWRTAGYNMAVFLSGLLSIPTETIEASIVDGASYRQRLTKVYFPQMIPSFIIATILCLITSFNLFEELLPLGALAYNKAAEFLSVLFFDYAFHGGRFALGMTMAVVTFIPVVILGSLLQRLQRRLQYYT